MNKVSFYMTREVAKVGPDTPLLEAINIMRDRKISSLLIEENDKVTGIFTERDLLMKVDMKGEEGLRNAKITDYMTHGVKTVDVEESYIDVIELMKKYNIRHMPVTQNGRIVGIVSLRDLLRRYLEQLEQLVELRETELLIKMKKLRESEERFRTIFENSAVAITFTDSNERIILWNSFTERMLGMDKNDLLNRPVRTLYPPEEWAKIRAQNIRKYGMKQHLETKVYTKSGQLIDIDISISVLKDAEGKIIGSIGIMRDVTERKRMEEALKRAKKDLEEKNARLREIDQLKSEFVSIVSHELRSPLTTIRESVSQVLDGVLGEVNDDQREFLSMCLEDIDRLRRIINDLLDLSKIEAGKLTLKREWVNIVELAKRVKFLFMAQAQSKGLEIRVTSSSDVIQMYIDKDKIVQVFTNLVNNALKFTFQGYVEISLADKENEVECRIIDTGIGIAEEDLPRVFDKFQQVGRKEGISEKGTGLGLTIAKGIVELHRGRMWVESKLNEGTQFIFILPKYSLEEVIRRSIDERLVQAEREGNQVTLFCIRWDNYSEVEKRLSKDKAEMLFMEFYGVLERVVRDKEFISRQEKGDVLILVGVNRENSSIVKDRLIGEIKKFAFRLTEDIEVDFSYGLAVYPFDGRGAESLIAKVKRLLVKEKEERLKKKIMIVDNNQDAVAELESFLKSMGYTNFASFINSTDALLKVRELRPDLIMLNSQMPEISGYDFIGRLKEDMITQSIPILLITDTPTDEEWLCCPESKAISRFSRPFDIKRLKKMVDYLL